MHARLALALGASIAASVPTHAQGPGAVGGRSEVFAGGELEGYLRYLQTLGAVAPHPWSIRAFSPRQLDAILPDTGVAHPWRARYVLARGGPRGAAVDLVRPTAVARYNSAFAYGSHDGPVWAGRGLTSSLQAGIAARWGPLSATVAPIVFRAENADFPLAANGQSGRVAYADLRFGAYVDRPRRFGDAPYAAFDPGQSTVRVDAGPVAVGASTANQTWGPGDRYPMVLGNSAAGFPHVFAGTAAPVDLRIAKVHARATWGRLDQSDYSPVTGSAAFASLSQPGRRRFTSGLVAVVQPRGVPGLELGGARFFHSPWRRGGPTGRDFRKPFEAFYKEDVALDGSNPGDPTSDVDNQLASVFARWVLPRSGFELAAEYYKEDHNYDVRDLVLEPDHNAGYALGARKAFRRADGTIVGVRAEVVNLEMSPLGQRRIQGLNYVGAYLRQGHTQRGQLLGADVGVGSTAGGTIGADWYTPRGRWSASWSRTLRQDGLPRDSRGFAVAADSTAPRALDVLHALGAEAVLFRGPLDVTVGTTAMLDFNREFRRDVFNLNAVVGVRYNVR